ncbi:MAG TPA: YdeI/OmpD-associated family protein [Sphingomicrobium sp.]|nr:YdeI/OmpD-associated family protein [Sphingomicrobium sp.]
MSRDPRIDAYIAKAQPFARPILKRVRERVHAAVPEAEETIKWGMPAYTLSGKIILITAAFKAHTALNFWRGQELETSHSSVGAMGQFGRINSVEQLPSDAELDRLIREAAELARSAPAPRKTKHEPKPTPEMHPEFTAALDKAPKAKAAFDNFAPSHRREYLEWVAEAKRDETRQKRIATTIEWLSEGKKRNCQYENC